MISGLIVKYRADVAAAQPVGLNLAPIGANLVTSADVATSRRLAEGLTTLLLDEPVTLASAELAAKQLERDSRVEWAEPDRMRRIIVDSVRPLSSTVDITVSGIDGSATRSNAFTYVAVAPTASSLSVAAGPTAGGTSVVVTGTNLSSVTSVTVGGTVATRNSTTSTTVTFTTPPKAAGTYDVVVTNSSGSATLANSFTYVAAPTIASVSPPAGTIAGGQTVTLTGTNLALTSSVTFGGRAATITSASSTSVEVTSPVRAAGAVNVVLTTPGGSLTKASAFTYAAAPTITTLSVTSGGTSGGTSVTINGTNLAFLTSVTFGGSAAVIQTMSSTSAVVTTPSGVAGVVNVGVSAPNGLATKAEAFTFVGSPVASSLNTTEGPLAGQVVVTLTGSNLTGVTSVTVGGTAATSVSTEASSVRFTTPAKTAGTYGVTVTSPFGTSTLANAFTYLPVPTVTSLSQSLGSSSGGQSVVISGTALGSTSSVTFGGAAGAITARTSTSVTVSTPLKAASTTAVSVVVTTPGGSVSKASAFTFAEPPTLTTIEPVVTSGTGGGTSVTIAGTNLLPVTAVSVGGVAATISAKTATTLSIVTPVQAVGIVEITATGPTGTVVKSDAITYELRPPVVKSMTPSSGSVDGGARVVVSGSNLGDVTGATFGGAPATVVSQTPTTLTLSTPAKVAGTARLVVTSPGGDSVDVRDYTFVVPPPTVTSVSPTAGRLSGSNVVTIRGTRLSATTAVKFGTSSSTAAAGTSLTIVSDTEIRVTTPPATAGAKSVYVISPSGTVTASQTFTYVAAPTITTVSPTSASRTGGSTLTINGSNLKGPLSVTVGGAAATILTNSTSRITATLPAGTAGVRSIVVVTPGGTARKSTGFSYTSIAAPKRTSATTQTSRAIEAPPVIDVSAQPAQVNVQSGAPVIKPSATDCASSSAANPIQRCFNDNDLDAGASLDGETIYANAYVAADAKNTLVVDIVPYVNISSDTWLMRNDTFVQAFFDVDADQMADMAIAAPDATLAVGASIAAAVYEWSGTAWVPRANSCSTLIKRAMGTHFAFPLESNNQWWQFSTNWSCLFGASASDVDVLTFLNDNLSPVGTDYAPDVWLGDGMNLTGLLQDAPSISSMSSSSGGAAGGSSITITGTGMSDVSSVSFGSKMASIVSRTPTQVVVTTPRAVTTGAVDVTVTGPGGSFVLASGFTYVSSAPTITSVSPNSGATDGGTSVTITGTNLESVSNVMFGNASATIVSKAATTLVVTSPAEGSGFVPTAPTEAAYSNGTLWGLTGAFGTKSNAAWNLTQGSSNVVVAVLDTGIVAHPDLGAQVPGYDMIASTNISNDGNGRDADPSDPGDWCGAGSSSSWHGTHVAGTINAAINGVGSVGVAPNVKVQTVRVLGTCGGSMSDITAAIIWAAGGTVSGVPVNANPADVISLSLGGDGACSASEQSAINFAMSRGAVVTVAAGNENSDASSSSPGNCAGVITVAATDSSGKRASFSNFGSYVEISAPGVGVYSTVNTGTTSPNLSEGGSSYDSWNGTSMATPHVAGVVALMLSRNPNLTPNQVLQRIRDTATAFGGGACDSNAAKTCGSGIINAGLAVQ